MSNTARAERTLDHFVDAVHDVDVAAGSYEKLGFYVLPKMRHVEIGSCNRIIQLAGTYLELVGDLDLTPPVLRDRLSPRFRCGEGLTMTSLTSTDLPGDHALLSAEADLDVHPILNARRRITMPDGSDDETDSHCFYVWNPRSTFLTLFLSQHYRPHTIWVPAYMRHANGALRVSALTLVADEPLAELSYFRTLLGRDPVSATDSRLQFVTARGELVELLAPSLMEERFGPCAPSTCNAFTGYGVGLRYEVEDLDRCRRLLGANAVPYADASDVIRIAAASAAGIVTEFAQTRSVQT